MLQPNNTSKSDLESMLDELNDRVPVMAALTHMGLNGGEDGGTNGRLGFARYAEVGGAIVCEEEIDYSDDPEVDAAIQLDEIVHPLLSAQALFGGALERWIFAGVACELCGEYVDRYGRCGCDY